MTTPELIGVSSLACFAGVVLGRVIFKLWIEPVLERHFK